MPPDLEVFEREILPAIQVVPLSDLVRATGLSLGYLSQLRRARKIPHSSHWNTLTRAAGGDTS
jgi:hypothetical protein